MFNEYFELNDKLVESMQSRREARRLAVQVLFSNEFLNEDIISVTNRVASTLEIDVNGFCKSLILKTNEHNSELDDLIHQNLRNWDLQRIAVLDRVLIRLALSELLYFNDIPVEVTINEALELSKEFINHKSSRFINGILDAILKKLEREKKIKKKLIARVPPVAKHKKRSTKGIKQ